MLLLSLLLDLLNLSFSSSSPTPTNITSSRSNNSSNPLLVSLPYATYLGYADTSRSLNTWRGIRFANDTSFQNRWKLPQSPTDESQLGVQNATRNGTSCWPSDTEGAYPNTANYYINYSEDCLFLNVFSPANRTSDDLLPVLFWIHGGGYAGSAASSYELLPTLKIDNNSHVLVEINYRLSALGFLAGSPIQEYGVSNVGLHDQRFALLWVQSYIHLFGGDKDNVIIWGQSAGGGSVLQHLISSPSYQTPPLFTRAIASSPFLPRQDWVNSTEQNAIFKQFARNLSCWEGFDKGEEMMSCLRTLNASQIEMGNLNVSESAVYGLYTWGPVVDGDFIPDEPSSLLLSGKVNGDGVLATNNIHDGYGFTPMSLLNETSSFSLTYEFFNSSEASYQLWLQLWDPLLSASDRSLINEMYPPPPYNDSGSGADEVGMAYEDQHLRASYVYQDSIFACPASWMVEGMKLKGGEGGAWRGVFGIEPGLHSEDLAYYAIYSTEIVPSMSFQEAFVGSLTSFLLSSNPNNNPYKSILSENFSFPSWPEGGDEALEFGVNENEGNQTWIWVNGLNSQKKRCNLWRKIRSDVPE